jgi:hypothetical protein
MYLEATESRPEVDLRFIDGKGFIRGVLREGHLNALFDAIIDHLDFEVGNHQGRQFLLDIDVDDLPSSAHPLTRRMLDVLDGHRKNGANVHVTWFCPAQSTLLRMRVFDIVDKYPKLVSKFEKK